MFDGPWESCMLVRGLNPGECASWVQAWGAIAAVAAGAIGLNWQMRNQVDLKRKEEVQLLTTVGQFVFDVRAKLRDIEEEALPHLHRNWTAVEAPVECIRAVAFDRYPVDQAAFSVAAALTSYKFMRDAYAGWDDDDATLGAVAHINKCRQHALASFFRAEQALEQSLKARRAHLPRMQMDFESGVSIRTLEPNPV